MKQRAQLGARARRPCSCGSQDGEHAFGCPQRPRRGAKPAKRAWLPRKRETPRRSSVVLDPEYVELVHLLPCVGRELPGHRCRGPIQAHHAGSYMKHGKGQQGGDDDDAIPCCEWLHRCIEDRPTNDDAFLGWSGPQLRAWQQIKILETRPRVERLREQRRLEPLAL